MCINYRRKYGFYHCDYWWVLLSNLLTLQNKCPYFLQLIEDLRPYLFTFERVFKTVYFFDFFFVLLGCHSHHTALVTWEYVLLHRTSLVPFSIEYQVWSKCEIHISNLYWAVQYPHLCSSFCWGEKILEVMTSFYYTYSLILYLNYAKIVFFCLS